MTDDKRQGSEADGPRCTVNSTLNFSIGAVSVAAGAALIWLGWRTFLG
jgi:hypothetical protein